MSELSLSSFEKILKDAGAKRVSEEAAIELRDIIEKFAKERGTKIVKAAEHAGRKTIKDIDIEYITQQS